MEYRGRKGQLPWLRSEHPMLRVAGPEDLDDLHAFEVRCFRDHPFRRDHVEWILGNDHALTLVQDGTDGFVAVMMLLLEGRSCSVLSFGVARDARRRGIAYRCMLAGEALWRGRKILSVWIVVNNRGGVDCKKS